MNISCFIEIWFKTRTIITMDTNYIKPNLSALGFTDNEIEIYVLLLSIWQSPASSISKRTKIKRVTVYAVLDSLLDKWLITSISKNNTKFFSALNPNKIKDFFIQKIEKEERKLLLANKIIPLLSQISKPELAKPQVTFFEWDDWVIEIFKETLNSKTDIKAFISTKNVWPKLKKFLLEDYADLRKKSGVFSKVIAPYSTSILKYQKNDELSYRETRICPKDTLDIDIEIDVFDDKVAFLAIWRKDELGVLVQNKSISSSIEKIFDLIWNRL